MSLLMGGLRLIGELISLLIGEDPLLIGDPRISLTSLVSRISLMSLLIGDSPDGDSRLP